MNITRVFKSVEAAKKEAETLNMKHAVIYKIVTGFALVKPSEITSLKAFNPILIASMTDYGNWV